MKVNARWIVEQRKKNAWSQEELACTAGLNLRTVQRIENQGLASLQSKKALAAAFDVAIEDLDYQEVHRMKQYQYKTMEIEWKEGFLAGLKKPQLPDLAPILNREGQDGWLLVQILTPELGQAAWSGKTGTLLALFQRERNTP